MASKSRADSLDRSQRKETNKRMNVKQILIFGLFLVPVLTHACHKEDALEGQAMKRLGHHFQQPHTASTTESPASCPLELYRKHAPQELSGRSLSPWRNVVRSMPNHFPHTYSEAECLCSGCILIEKGPEGDKRLVLSDDYNSVTITQSKLFLKKELCEDGERYRLKPVYVRVNVGCTCARARS
uniref:interleukin-17C n=1 Tax=Semicossyphus pulcher TaxID=241346 RepID=UPI0037E96344